MLLTDAASQTVTWAVLVQGICLAVVFCVGLGRAVGIRKPPCWRKSIIPVLTVLWIVYLLLRALCELDYETQSLFQTFRSTAPVTLPLIAILPWFWSMDGTIAHKILAWSSVVGIFQLCLMLWIQITGSTGAPNAQQALVDRITILDPRTTQTGLCFLFALLSPASLLHAKASIRIASSLAFSAALALSLGAVMRSILLVAGIELAIGLVACLSFPQLTRRKIVRSLLMTTAAAFVGFLLLIQVPLVGSALDALGSRLTSSSLGEARTEDEWIPALEQSILRQPTSLAIAAWGIGPAATIETESKDVRPFVHNIVLQWLVFYGVTGLTLGMMLLIAVGRGLALSVRTAPSLLSVAAGCAFSGLVGYSLVFAVHKLVLFNFQLGILALIATRTHEPKPP